MLEAEQLQADELKRMFDSKDPRSNAPANAAESKRAFLRWLPFSFGPLALGIVCIATSIGQFVTTLGSGIALMGLISLPVTLG